MSPFHLAIPVKDLAKTEAFYVDILGVSIGRKAEKWIDFNFWGHQVSVHLKPEECQDISCNEVDDHAVPVRHFGMVLPWEEWHALADRLRNEIDSFIIEPYIRFEGKPGEQATMFIKDPNGHALEFKSFKDPAQLFAD